MSRFPIVFNDGRAYERAMGIWSQLVGRAFLDWLAPSSGLRWLDVGCGNGALTELLVQRGTAAEIQGIDPSEAQLEFARNRMGAGGATFARGDAERLPFASARFDATVMALVLFFVPSPETGVAEMRRVTSPGGIVAAYVWDTVNGASPMAPINAELKARGITMAMPPRADISGAESLNELWTGAGLETIEARQITVRRSFADQDEFWQAIVSNTSVGPLIAKMATDEVEHLRAQTLARLTAGPGGSLSYEARANAIRGRVPLRNGS
jgi:SAM-dependent methyltransferase